MAEFKEFKGRILFRGHRVEVEFCAENLREAAEVLNQSKYQIKMHFTYEPIETPYNDIVARVGGLVPPMSLDDAKKLLND